MANTRTLIDYKNALVGLKFILNSDHYICCVKCAPHIIIDRGEWINEPTLILDSEDAMYDTLITSCYNCGGSLYEVIFGFPAINEFKVTRIKEDDKSLILDVEVFNKKQVAKAVVLKGDGIPNMKTLNIEYKTPFFRGSDTEIKKIVRKWVEVNNLKQTTIRQQQVETKFKNKYTTLMFKRINKVN